VSGASQLEQLASSITDDNNTDYQHPQQHPQQQHGGGVSTVSHGGCDTGSQITAHSLPANNRY